MIFSWCWLQDNLTHLFHLSTHNFQDHYWLIISMMWLYLFCVILSHYNKHRLKISIFWKYTRCNGDEKRGPWGRFSYQRIGKWGCYVHLVFYIGHLTVFTYTIFPCLGVWADTTITSPFILRHDWTITGKPEGRCPPWRIIPLQHPPPGTTRALKIFKLLNWLGYPPYQNSILQEQGGL